MKHNKDLLFAVSTAILVSLAISFLPLAAAASSDFAPQKSDTKQIVSPAWEKQTVSEFNERVKAYVRLRNGVKDKVPKLSKDAKPEQIEAYQKSFVEALRAARAAAKPGDIFTPEIASYFRRAIKRELTGSDKKELRETVLEAETQGVPMRVNYPYPDTKELTEMPAKLLLKLPQLPKEVKYRFVRRHLLLVDTDNDLIVDYMLNALP